MVLSLVRLTEATSSPGKNRVVVVLIVILREITISHRGENLAKLGSNVENIRAYTKKTCNFT